MTNTILKYKNDDNDNKENLSCIGLIEYLCDNIQGISNKVFQNIINNNIDGEVFFDEKFSDIHLKELGCTEINMFHIHKMV